MSDRIPASVIARRCSIATSEPVSRRGALPMSTKERLLEENWRLRFQVSSFELELSALRLKTRYLEDTASFVSEKIRLESVVSELLFALAGRSTASEEANLRLEALIEKSGAMVREATAALAGQRSHQENDIDIQ